jgi:hypothetical protein
MFIWIFHHKDLGYHLLQLCSEVVIHPVHLWSSELEYLRMLLRFRYYWFNEQRTRIICWLCTRIQSAYTILSNWLAINYAMLRNSHSFRTHIACGGITTAQKGVGYTRKDLSTAKLWRPRPLRVSSNRPSSARFGFCHHLWHRHRPECIYVTTRGGKVA